MADFFSGVEAAIGGAAVGALQSQSEWAGLKAQVAAGTLRMEPGVAEACAKACQTAHDDLGRELGNTRQLSRVHGLGSWQSGQSIAQKFRGKAGAENPSANSAGGVIRSHRDVLLEMRDTFRAAGQAYAAAEQANANRLRGLS